MIFSKSERRKPVGGLLALRPDFAMAVRRDYTKWWDSKRVEHFIEGLHKAGLEIPDQQ
jgi:hypothetical protein